MTPRLVFASLTLALVAAGCSKIDTVDCIENTDCPAGEICVAGDCVVDASGGDAATSDSGTVDGGTSDGGVDGGGTDGGGPDDGGTDADSGVDADVSELTTFGEPCLDSAECASGICADTAIGGLCTRPCTDGCPDDWDCRGITPDDTDEEIEVCFPEEEGICNPCEVDTDCAEDLYQCQELDDGFFCLSACGDACAEGFICEIFGEDDEQVALCVPDSGFCTACEDDDDDGFGVGPACDVQDCAPGDMSIYPGADEVCNGEDDDCDGEADEDFDFTSIETCGSCDNRCNENNATAECSAMGECLFDCLEGFDDCDDDASNGCESDLLNSEETCGSCGSVCALDNAEEACDDGNCALVRCLDGYADANGEPEDGCECEISLEPDELDYDAIDSNCDGVDGEIERSIYVDPLAESGGTGLTPDSPLNNLFDVGDVLADTGRDQVLMASGTFDVTSPIQIDDGGFTLWGGYNRGFNARTDFYTTVNSFGRNALVVEELEEVLYIAGMEFATDDRTGSGQWTAAVVVTNVEDLFVMEDCIISAGNGGDGAPGERGRDGEPGESAEDGTIRRLGESGADTGIFAGGDGGNGESGQPGQAGSNALSAPGTCGRGGDGGSPVRFCVERAAPGQPGADGCPGADGDDGIAGDGIGRFVDNGEWRASVVTNGSGGQNGSGGGGGGAGAGSTGGCSSSSWGGGGGGGGGGGRGGLGGQAGEGGGASIALILVNSQIELYDVLVETGEGGDGGNGGSRGFGGAGGAGGRGNQPSDAFQGNGGDGGDGGRGGDGGCGGGGGGGPSVGIWGIGDAVIFADGLDFEIGTGGTGGTSCSATGAGENGIAEDFRDVAIAVE